MKQSDFDVIVIGGGHAGADAALAAARTGVRTALLTLSRAGIGVMSCNPAIGGLGKGHLVREIDALDGIMGRAADHAGIQFRLLNRKKGPAVQGPRAQADRARYRRFLGEAVSGMPGLTVLEGEAADLAVDGRGVTGVVLADGAVLTARAVVLTTGTFLRGTIHVGDVSRPGGRVGEPPSVRLAERLSALGLPMGRLKTGTPPRLRGSSIDWGRLEEQPGDEEPSLFSFLSTGVACRQISCGITHTNERTHDIIRENLGRSAMYGGHIEGIGPRYCPSIEDKIVRFADKTSHQVFLEPEGLDDDTVYPNGISTSLPADVQVEYVRSMVGLESAEILQPGYAIEYDFVDPRALTHGLMLKSLDGLFLAGQINGTTGYEEAAAQGLVAGVNAARYAREMDPALFSRAESYIGVMVDDLVTRGVQEPYRMFTSRAEFRLTLRADNADQRLTAFGRELGLVSDARWAAFEGKMEALDRGRESLAAVPVTARALAAAGVNINPDKESRSALDALSLTDCDFDALAVATGQTLDIAPEVREQIKRDALYRSYIDRQQRDIDTIRREESERIPEAFDYAAVDGLSNELKGKLARARPATIGHASRVDGMTPSAILLLIARIRRQAMSKSA